MIFIFYCYLAISLTFQLSRSASPKKHIYFQIDEFIKQLMTSEKFDELTDVIADKAAQKIRNIDSQSTSHVDKSALRNLVEKERTDPKPDEKSNDDRERSIDKDLRSDEKSIYNYEKKKDTESRIDEKPSRNREKNKDSALKSDDEKTINSREKNKGNDSKSKEKSSYGHKKQKEKSSRSDEKFEHDRKDTNINSEKKDSYHKSENIGKIDTQTFLQNHMTSKELELNFKHLKGELEKHRFDVKENNIKSHKDERYDKNKGSEKNRAVDNHEDDVLIKNKLKKIDSKELLLSDGSSEKRAHEQATFHDAVSNKKDNRNSGDNKSTNDSDADNEEKINKEFTYDKNSNDKPVPRITKQNGSEEYAQIDDDIENAKTFINKVMDKVSLELNNLSYSSKEVLDVGINRAHGDMPQDKIQIHSGTPKGKVNAGKVKRRIDERISTLQTSAEYAEYHESSAIRPKFQFINTYK